MRCSVCMSKGYAHSVYEEREVTEGYWNERNQYVRPAEATRVMAYRCSNNHVVFIGEKAKAPTVTDFLTDYEIDEVRT